MTEERIEPRNISMYPSDWEAVAQVADLSGVKSLSCALRIIIREWKAQQEERHASNAAPVQNPAPAM